MTTKPLTRVDDLDPERPQPSKLKSLPTPWSYITMYLGLDSESDRVVETALLLSLAEYSGWSAELISNNLHKKCGFYLMPEVVWEIHHSWVARREASPYQASLDKQISDAMLVLLKDFAVDVPFRARPLNKTPRPVRLLKTFLMHGLMEAGICISCRRVEYEGSHQSAPGRLHNRLQAKRDKLSISS